MKLKFKIYIISILAVLLRIVYLFYQSPHITVDASYWGLAARDITDFRYFPIWRYGSTSIGSLFSYLVSLCGLIFKINIYSLVFIELIFSFLFIISTYRVGKYIFGRRGGMVSLLVVSFAPSLLIKLVTFPNGVYNILLFLGNIMFILALRIWDGKDKRLYTYGIFGFISGISLWTHFYAICFIIPCIVFILFKKRFKIKPWLVFIVLFFAGSAPFWLFNFRNDFLTFKDITLMSVENILFYDAKDIFLLQLNNILNVNSFFGISSMLLLIYLFCFFYFLYRLNNNLFKSKESLILLFIVFGIAVITKVRVNPRMDIHPSILLYAGFIYAVSYGLINIRKKSRIVFLTAVASIIVLQLGCVFLDAISEGKNNVRKNKALMQEISQLKMNNIHYVCTLRDLAPILKFITNGSMVVDCCEKLDYLPYDEFINIEERQAILLPLEDAGEFLLNLKYICSNYKTLITSHYVLFYSFVKPQKAQIKISSNKWEAVSNYNDKDARLAFDGDIITRWTSDVWQRTGMYYQLDLKKEILLDKIAFYLDKDIFDNAIGLGIEVSRDNKNWRQIVYLEDNKNRLFWDGPYLNWKNYANKQEFYFKPVRARYVRFNQSGSSNDYYWSIHEVEVFSPL